MISSASDTSTTSPVARPRRSDSSALRTNASRAQVVSPVPELLSTTWIIFSSNSAKRGRMSPNISRFGLPVVLTADSTTTKKSCMQSEGA